jgi:hypothetical protein
VIVASSTTMNCASATIESTNQRFVVFIEPPWLEVETSLRLDS